MSRFDVQSIAAGEIGPVGSPVRRDQLIDRFLEQSGWGGSRRVTLAADASFRRYDRIHGTTRTAVLMDAPPPRENVRPFIQVARLLRGLDFSAPEILAEDTDSGLLLLEDLGDLTYTRVLNARGPAAEEELYGRAIDVLIALHRRLPSPAATPELAALPRYDEQRLLEEALLFVDWYLPAILGAPLAEDLREEYLALWRDALALLDAIPSSLVLRDYHVDNLMVLPGRKGLAGCGLLDFQDAVTGPVTYDLVSLLEDARRDVSPGLAAAMLARYRDAIAQGEAAAFDAAYALLGAQRNAKIIGIFTRLDRRDGKPRYLKHIPRVWRLLEGDLRHPVLAELSGWFDRILPHEQRRAPEPGAPGQRGAP